LYVGCGELVALGDAERGIVLAQEGEDVVGEPALVAELEGERNVRVAEG
jgi:hypothetical protein